MSHGSGEIFGVVHTGTKGRGVEIVVPIISRSVMARNESDWQMPRTEVGSFVLMCGREREDRPPIKRPVGKFPQSTKRWGRSSFNESV